MRKIYNLFVVLSVGWIVVMLMFIIILLSFCGCVATKPIQQPIEMMEVHYDVVADSVELQYSVNSLDWKKDTILTNNQAVIIRPLREFNRLRVVLGNEIVYSKMIHL